MIALQWFRAQDPARTSVVAEGYKEREVRTIIRLRTDGTFVDRTVLPAKEPRTVLLPYTQRSSGIVADLIDNHEYVFGAGAPGRAADDATRRAEAYTENLRQYDHPATRAILRYLEGAPPIVPIGDTATPELIAALEAAEPQVGSVPLSHAAKATLKKREWLGHWASTLQSARQTSPTADPPTYTPDVPSGLVLFEVEGHPEWWMDEVFLAAKRSARSATQGDVRGRCSLCYREDQPLARLLDPTSISKGPSISSFNIASFTAFNREQNYTAPTCQDCAGQMVRGFNAIVDTPHTAKVNPADTYHALLWWAPTLSLDLWGSIFDVALSTYTDAARTERPREERLAALDRIPPESYFLDVRRNERRLAFLRHAYVTRAALTERLRAAVEADLDFNHTVKALSLLTAGGGETGEKAASTHWREALVIDLLGGEPLGPRDVRHILNVRRETESAYARDHLTRLIVYLNRGAALMPKREPTPEEVACTALGRALAHVDRVQYLQNRAAVPHSKILLRAAVQSPRRVRADLPDKAWYRATLAHGKREVQDRSVMAHYLGSRDLPERRLTLAEESALKDGFAEEREAIFTAARDRSAGHADEAGSDEVTGPEAK